MRRLTVAVSGKPGTGKTTYARHIAQVFNLRYVSSGELFRRIAQERGIDLVELHRLAELDESIDREVDVRALREAERGGVVIEGHLAVWLLSEHADLKIVLVAPLEVRVERVAKREAKPIVEVEKEVRTRELSNRARALKYYGVDIEDLSIADIVINTAALDVEGVKRVLETFVREYLRLHPDKA
ncbi:MAG: AAA family ATPase [Thermofilaceae archaeon]